MVGLEPGGGQPLRSEDHYASQNPRRKPRAKNTCESLRGCCSGAGPLTRSGYRSHVLIGVSKLFDLLSLKRGS